MSYSTSRLTLFAVLGAIETDLRNLIIKHLDGVKTQEEVFDVELRIRVQARIEKDFGTKHDDLSINHLIEYIDFGDAIAILNSNAVAIPSGISHALRAMTVRIDKLVAIRNRVMHSRPLQFDDLAFTLDVAEDLIKSTEIYWEELRNTLRKLELDPSFVLGLEIPSYLREETETDRKHNLPIPDFDETGFLGRKTQVSELTKHCLGPYPVVSVVGDGGIGKTALALKVAYDILDMTDCPFEAIVWTSSKTTQLTAQEIVKIEGAIHDVIGQAIWKSAV